MAPRRSRPRPARWDALERTFPGFRLLPKSSSGAQTLPMSRSHDLRVLAAAVGPPLAAAVAGNAFIGRDSLRWYRQLRHTTASAAAAGLRARGGHLLRPARDGPLSGVPERRSTGASSSADRVGRQRTVAFLGRRSPRNGFAGTQVFLVPLLALQRPVASDPPSMIALTPYTLWVVGYDVPWSYRLWRLNPG